MYSQVVNSSELPRVERLATGDVERREDRLQQQLRAAQSKSLATETAEDREARLLHHRTS